jgi:hypothetical protein
MDGLNAWWPSMSALDMHLLLGLLSLGAAALIGPAIFSDLFHVRRISIRAAGLSVHWSHSPRLLGASIEATRELAWPEVVHLEWQEGRLEHDLKQYLVICLRLPLNRKQRRLKLLVCDHQNTERCEAVLASIPGQLTAPSWLVAARARGWHCAI